MGRDSAHRLAAVGAAGEAEQDIFMPGSAGGGLDHLEDGAAPISIAAGIKAAVLRGAVDVAVGIEEDGASGNRAVIGIRASKSVNRIESPGATGSGRWHELEDAPVS